MLKLTSRQRIAITAFVFHLVSCILVYRVNVAAPMNGKSAGDQVDAVIQRWEAAVGAGASENAAKSFEAIKDIGPGAIPRLIEIVEAGPNSGRRVFAMACLTRWFSKDARAAEPVLLRLVAKGADPLQIAAMYSLDDIAPEWAEKSVPLLAKLLDERDRDLRRAALVHLHHAGPAAQGIELRLVEIMKRDDDGTCRTLAAEALATFAPDSPNVIGELVKALDDLEGLPARQIIGALGRCGARAKDAVPRLIQILGDEDAPHRWDAAGALGAIGPEAKAAIPALMDRFGKEKEALIRAAIAEALLQIGAEPQALIDRLLRDCRSNDVDVVQTAICSLGRIGSPAKDAVSELLPLLKDDDMHGQGYENSKGRLRGAAVIALGRIGADRESVVPALKKCLGDHELSVRVASAVALSQYGVTTTDSLATLTNALKSRDYNAVPALSAMDTISRGQVPLLLAMTSHKEKYQRVFGINALAACRTVTDDMLSAISQRLKDQDSYVRVAAARALGNMGPRAKTQAHALREVIGTDKDWAVREAARDAVNKIDSPAGGTNERPIPGRHTTWTRTRRGRSTKRSLPTCRALACRYR
jgi:HEAT repeat protein